MAIGRRRTGEVVGGDDVVMCRCGLAWFTIHPLSVVGFLFFRLFLQSLLFSSYSSWDFPTIRSLRFCLCSPVYALSLSLYSFLSVSISLRCFVLRILCFITFSLSSQCKWVASPLSGLPPTPPSLPSIPPRCCALPTIIPLPSSQIAEFTAYCTYSCLVLRCNVCIS